MSDVQTSDIWLGVYDLHYPEHDKKVWNAVMAFIRPNRQRIKGFVWGGDNLNCGPVSPHESKKKRHNEGKRLVQEIREFDEQLFTPLDELLTEDCEKIWLHGNHEDWIEQYLDEHPELEGAIEPSILLRLKERGWKVKACGEIFRKGKLKFIHGETLSKGSGVYHAKKAVEMYCGNVVYGHFHSPQSFTKILPHDETGKWQSWCVPTAGGINPDYLRNAPTAWLPGFLIVEFSENGAFNCYPVVVINGKFAFGGKVYRG